MTRPQTKQIIQDLNKKMVFLSGPRQVGKTTLAKSLESHFKSIQYLNYDSDEDRSILLNNAWSRKMELVLFDEIHKLKKWKTKLKGIYDTEGLHPKILVTGSARLDIYRRGGDSLAGRYFLHRLYPFSVKELSGTGTSQEIMENLIKFGGFPEPYFSQSEQATARWRKQHIERIVREDVQDLEPVKDIQTLILLIDLLRQRVGSPVSANSLAQSLEVSPHTIKRWIQILCNMYVIFLVRPYNKKMNRALLKEPKIYFYDTSSVKGDIGAKFENMVAVCLLKHLHFLEDTQGNDVDLCYLRDKEKREVDFVTLINNKLTDLIECKWSDAQLSPSLKYYAERLNTRATQLVGELKQNRTHHKINISQAADWLAKLEN